MHLKTRTRSVVVGALCLLVSAAVIAPLSAQKYVFTSPGAEAAKAAQKSAKSTEQANRAMDAQRAALEKSQREHEMEMTVKRLETDNVQLQTQINAIQNDLMQLLKLVNLLVAAQKD